MITFETLRKIEQQERNSAKLSDLPERFLEEAKQYLEKKEKMATGKIDEWELKTAVRRLQEILEFRERKIVNFALTYVRSGVAPGGLLPEEKQLFESTVASVKDFKKRRWEALSGTKKNFKAIAFLEDVPQFIGTDMINYGPYSRGDIATVPEENAKLLLDKKAAEVIEN